MRMHVTCVVLVNVFKAAAVQLQRYRNTGLYAQFFMFLILLRTRAVYAVTRYRVSVCVRGRLAQEEGIGVRVLADCG